AAPVVEERRVRVAADGLLPLARPARPPRRVPGMGTGRPERAARAVRVGVPPYAGGPRSSGRGDEGGSAWSFRLRAVLRVGGGRPPVPCCRWRLNMSGLWRP